MQSLFDYVIEPKDGLRYNNTKEVDGKELITNTQIFTHQNVNRIGIVKSLPKVKKENIINVGDEVVVHHNIFRRYHDIRGNEKNGRAYINDNNYLCAIDQIFAYKKTTKWSPLEGYCFVKPIESNNIYSLNKEKPLVGILKYKDICLTADIEEGDLVGFTPVSEYEFILNEERLYRVRSKNLTIKYEYEGNEKEYNPSWS